MSRAATIQARIDPEIKAQAQEILRRLNLSMSDAISLFLTQVALQRGLPFPIKIPNALTAETLRRAEAGEELHPVNDADALFRELEQ